MSTETEAPPAADPAVDGLPAGARIIPAAYAGRRWHGFDQGLEALWVTLREDGAPDEKVGFRFAVRGKKTPLTDRWVGDVYELVEYADGKTFSVRPRRLKTLDDAGTLARWRAEERAAEAQAEMERRQRKAGGDFGALTVAEASELYHKAIGSARRAAVLASIIQAVTG